MISVSTLMQAYLVSENLINEPGDKTVLWPGYIGFIPDGNVPDNLICVIDSNPILDGRLMTGETILHPGFQILVRARTYPIGHAKSVSLFEHLEMVKNEDVMLDSEDYVLKNVSPTTGVLYLGNEKDSQERLNSKKRYMFSLNFKVTL